MLRRIQATLDDAERRKITDKAVQLWLTELRDVAYAADDVLDKWRYEQLKAQAEARINESKGNPSKGKLTEIPKGLADQIKDIRCRFDEISKDRLALQLLEEDGARISNPASSPIPTSHMVNESNIFGRENEKEEVISRLISDCGQNNLMVVSIVGMGGLGKTTLAQLVYNDERVHEKFDKLGWVYVSNDFNVQRLTKSIFESLTGHSSDLTELSTLQGNLKLVVTGKSIFLVFDDVWNEQQNHWECLVAPFVFAKKISILVTTRNQSVALIAQTVPFIELSVMPDEQCWKLFQHYAFGGIPGIEHSGFSELGRRIMCKCSGLPLAVKTIASLLRYEIDERKWAEILQSAIWEAYPDCKIFGALQISCMRLPHHLKTCFLFCSMFPKGYLYKPGELINLWLAHDYVVSRGKKSKEEAGMEYVKELKQRSLLEVACSDGSHVTRYKIHDVVHDLLCLISKGVYRELHDDIPINTADDIFHHVFINMHSGLAVKHIFPPQLVMLRTLIMRCLICPQNISYLSNAQRLRALELVFNTSDHYNFHGQLDCLKSKIHYLHLICQMKHLRHLVLRYCKGDLEPICQLFNLRFLWLSGCELTWQSLPESFFFLNSLEILYIDYCNLRNLPERFGELIHLRELRINSCQFREIPNSICELRNLKRLTFIKVDDSKWQQERRWQQKLVKLPKAIGNLSSLQELYINADIKHLPHSFSNVYNFCRSTKLHRVLVGKNSGIGWLRYFKNLKGALCLESLGNLVNTDEIKQGTIVAMHNLEELVLGWTLNPAIDISSSRENILFVSAERAGIVSGTLEGFTSFNRTGSLASPPYLEHFLSSEWDDELESEDELDHPHRFTSSPPYLRHLLSAESKDESKSEDESEWENPSVSVRKTNRMHSEEIALLILESLQPHPNLKRLDLSHYPGKMLPMWMGNPFVCSLLETISIGFCGNLDSLPFGSLCSLRNFELHGCECLLCLHEDSLPPQLEKLNVAFSDNIISMPVLWKLVSLVELKISLCSNLKPFLVELGDADWLPPASCSVEIRKCPLLKDWCIRQGIRYIK